MLPTKALLFAALGLSLDFFDAYIAEKKAKYPDAAPALDEFLETVRAKFGEPVTGQALAEMSSQVGDLWKTLRSEAPHATSDLG
jgi:hypothetical protein